MNFNKVRPILTNARNASLAEFASRWRIEASLTIEASLVRRGKI
jgi:hypothetical protein